MNTYTGVTRRSISIKNGPFLDFDDGLHSHQQRHTFAPALRSVLNPSGGSCTAPVLFYVMLSRRGHLENIPIPK